MLVVRVDRNHADEAAIHVPAASLADPPVGPRKLLSEVLVTVRTTEADGARVKLPLVDNKRGIALRAALLAQEGISAPGALHGALVYGGRPESVAAPRKTG